MITLVVVTSLGSVAYGQEGKCASSNGIPTVARCPNEGCGEVYYNYSTFRCTGPEPCLFWAQIMICCGAYQNYEYAPEFDCWYTMFKNQEVRSRLQELAKTRQILVPNCRGAYVPAELLFKNPQVSDDASI